MNTNTKIGCFFFAVSAFLYATKHITAAIMITNINSAQTNYFAGGYESIGWGITLWIAISFLAGCFFFLRGLLPALVQKLTRANKE